MRSKRPLALVISFAVALTYFLYDAYQRRNVALDNHDRYIVLQEEHVKHYIRVGHALAGEDQAKGLQETLEDARALGDLDFFIVQKNGQPLFWGTADGKADSVNQDFTVFDQMMGDDDVRFMSTRLDDETVLTVGANTVVSAYLKQVFSEDWLVLVNDMIVVGILFVAFVAYFIRDIMAVVTLLRGGGNRSSVAYRNIKSKSKESEVLIQSLMGYEEAVASLRNVNQTFGNQLLPSLKSEILSGKKPPYDFACTMVRTDINNFSTIYNNHSVDDFMRVINDYFTEVSHIVARYKGFIHEFLGDEVIFYFKDEHCRNSVETALSAIRDVNEAAERVQAFTLKTYGYPFTVKSALSYGMIRFGPLVNGHSLAGSVLIESVRILSHVVEKEGNVACFEAANLSRLQDVTVAQEYARVNLKGFSGTKTLYRYMGHTPLEQLLSTLSEENASYLTYYRSDESLARILRHLCEGRASLAEPVTLKTIRVLRDVPVTKASVEVVNELLDWLEALASADAKADGKVELRVLSAASMLAMNLVPQEAFTAEVDERLSRLLLVSDRRVVANVLDVLTYFKSGGDPKFVSNLLRHEDNRILANALVHEGNRDISPRVLKALKRMLSGKSDASHSQTASALYAIGEIAAHHRSRDVVYYNAQVEFHQLFDRLPELVVSENSMIRRQAMIATRKIDDAILTEKTVARIRRLGDPERLAEAREHFDQSLFQDSVESLKKIA